MARPDRSDEKRAELLPVLAAAFAELGYGRATTAALAERAGVRENVLYRLWPDKRALFLAAIDHVYRRSEAAWTSACAAGAAGRAKGRSAASELLAYEARHLGEHGLYRILFAALAECDDDDVREALRGTYLRFHRFARDRVREHRGDGDGDEREAALIAWALVGLGTAATIGRELGLLGERRRQELLGRVGAVLLDCDLSDEKGRTT